MPGNPESDALRQILQRKYNEFVSDVGWEEATHEYWFHPDHFDTWERIRQACPEITAIMQRIEERGYYANQDIGERIEETIFRLLFHIAIPVLVENDQSTYTMQDILRTVADLDLWIYESDDESEEDEEDDENEGSGPMDEDRNPPSTDVQMGF